MSVDLPVQIVIENAQVRQRAIDAIQKQLSNFPEKFGGNLKAGSQEIENSLERTSKRIRTIVDLISKGQDTRNPAIKNYFDLLDRGSQAAVTRLVAVKKALRDLRDQKIDAAQFEVIKNQATSNRQGQQLRSPNLQSAVEKLIDDDIADYGRLVKVAESSENRILSARKVASEKAFAAYYKAYAARIELSKKEQAAEIARLETSVANEKQKFIDGAIKDQLKNENALYKSNQNDINKAFKDSVDERINIAADLKKDIQDRSKLAIAESERVLKEQIENETRIQNVVNAGVEGNRRSDAERKEAERLLDIRKEERALQAQNNAEKLRIDTVGKSNALDLNQAFEENVKQRQNEAKTLSADIASRYALEQQLEQTSISEQQKNSERLRKLEAGVNKEYEKRINLIRQQQQITREFLTTVDKKSLSNPSNELSQLVRFANDDPRNFVAPPGPPGGGPPNKPPTGGGTNFFNDDGEARRTVSRLRSIVTQQEKFGSTVRRFGELAGLATKRYSAFLLGTFAITKLTAAFSAANQEALQFERLIGRLSQTIRVFNDTADQARERGQAVGDAILQAARRTGVASNEIAAGVVEIAQAGNEQLGALQFVADQLANSQLSASFDDTKSTAEGLIAIFGQFNIQTSATADIIDKLNQVSVEYAVESGNFFEAVKRGGATFAGLGGNLEEFIELLTLARSSTRLTATTLGTFFKTGLGRLSKNSQQQIFKEFGVGPTDENRSVIDQLRDLASTRKFTNLSDTERTRTTIALFGAQQAGPGEALLRELNKQARLKNSGGRTVQDAILESTGSVARDINIVDEDVNRSLGRISQSFQSFFNVLLQDKSVRSFFKNLADSLALLTEFTTENKNFINGIIRLTTAVSLLVVAFKGLEFLNGIRAGFTGLSAGINATTASATAASKLGTLSGIGQLGRSVGSNRANAAVLGLAGAAGVASFASTLNFNPFDSSTKRTNNERIFESVAGGASVGGIIGAGLGGPIGGAIGIVLGGLSSAISENTRITKENTDALFTTAFGGGNTSTPQGRDALSENFAQGVASSIAGSLQVNRFSGIFGKQITTGPEIASRLAAGNNDLVATANTGSLTGRLQELEANAISERLFNKNNTEVVTFFDKVIKEANFSSEDLSSSANFDKALKRVLTNASGPAFNKNENIFVDLSVIPTVINKFLTETFDKSKELQKRLNDQIESFSKDLFDNSLFSDLTSNIRSVANAFNIGSEKIEQGFEKTLDALNKFVINIDDVSTINAPQNNSDLLKSVGVSFPGLDSLTRSLTSTIEQIVTNPLLIKNLREASQNNSDLRSTDSVEALQSPDVALTRLLIKDLKGVTGLEEESFTQVFQFLGSFTGSLSDSIAALAKLADESGNVSDFVKGSLGTDVFEKGTRSLVEKTIEVFNERVQKERIFVTQLNEIRRERIDQEISLSNSSIEIQQARAKILPGAGQAINNDLDINKFLLEAARKFAPNPTQINDVFSTFSQSLQEESALRQESAGQNDNIELTQRLNTLQNQRITAETSLNIVIAKLTNSVDLSAKAADGFAEKAKAARDRLSNLGEQSISGSVDRKKLDSGADLIRNVLTSNRDNSLRDRENQIRRARRRVGGGGTFVNDELPASSDFNISNLSDNFRNLSNEAQKTLVETLKTIGDQPIFEVPNRNGQGSSTFTGNSLLNNITSEKGLELLVPLITRITGRKSNDVEKELRDSFVKNEQLAKEARELEINSRKDLAAAQNKLAEKTQEQFELTSRNITALTDLSANVSANTEALRTFFDDLNTTLEDQTNKAINGNVGSTLSVQLAPVQVEVNINPSVLGSLTPMIQKEVYSKISKVLDDLAKTFEDEPEKAAKIRGATNSVDPDS